jgi:glycerophosphoryl diester phosphodiesterase
VHEHTLAQVRSCDAAWWWVPGVSTLLPGKTAVVERDPAAVYPLRGRGVRVPTAREFFSYVKSLGERAPQVTVEIKNIPYDSNFDPIGHRMADVLVPLLHELGLTRRTVVESFWPASIARVKRLDPSVRTLFLTLGSATLNLAYMAVSDTDVSSSDILAPDFGAVYVHAVHALCRRVVPWLVESRADWKAVAPLGVDGVLTSSPACILLAMGRRVPRPYVTPEAGLASDVPACAA